MTRARIAEAALKLFSSQGFPETTIDQIADAAGVGRRTIFRHFATKESILFDHFIAQREAVIQLLKTRPPAEPVLKSLYIVLREVCAHGYDRRLLSQVRDVLVMTPQLVGAALGADQHRFKNDVVATIQGRCGDQLSLLEIHAMAYTALGWAEAATAAYLTERDRSLVECFDETVAISLQSASSDLASSPKTTRPTRRRRRRSSA